MGSIHPTDFIIYDFNKKRLQFEGLFQRPHDEAPLFLYALCMVSCGNGNEIPFSLNVA